MGLHPYAIEVVASLIKSAAVHTTIIVATQSVALVNHFEAEDIVVVNRVRGESKFERLDRAALSEWLRPGPVCPAPTGLSVTAHLHFRLGILPDRGVLCT